MTHTNKTEVSRLENIASKIVLGTVFLLPFFFIPVVTAPFQITKTTFLFLGVLIAFFLYVISRLESGKLFLPYHKITFAAWLLPVVYLVSALLSSTPRTSLLGTGFDVDTFGFIFGAVLFFTLIPLLVRTKEKILRLYILFLLSFIVLAVVEIARLFLGVDVAVLSFIPSLTPTLLGKWNDFSILTGLVAILSLTAFAGLTLVRQQKYILYSVLGAALFLLAIINFSPVWVVLGLFSLGFFVYSLSRRSYTHWRQGTLGEDDDIHKHNNKNTTPFPALLVLVVSLAFIIFGNFLGTYTTSAFNLNKFEARPSWQSTIDIGKRAYENNTFFGSGPNTFMREWVQHKPVSINSSFFWNIDFTSGIGFVPTSFITTGVLGILAWLIFLGMFLYTGLRVLIMKPVEELYTYFLLLSSFLGSFYLWVMAFLYVPNTTLIAFALLFTGIFVTSLRFQEGIQVEKEIVFAANPRLGFIAILLLTIFLIVDAVGMYVVGQQYLSNYYLQNSAYALNVDGDVDAAEKNITRSIRLDRTDRGMRFMSEVQLVKLNQTFSETDVSPEEQRKQFQEFFGNAVQSAQLATVIDPQNYQNWMTLGRVYGSVVSLNIEGAYENTIQSYEKALELNPNNPLVYLTLAQLAVIRGNNEEARNFIFQALEKKNNYTPAVFLLAQIQVQEGNLEEAITSVEAATILDPRNPVTFFQLGMLRLNQNDDLGVINALEQAVALNETYSNARYFLGLAYYRVGKNQDAIDQFERVASLNPENDQVKTILNNLRSGKDPLEKLSEEIVDSNQLPISEE